jgi:hypothetical protein
VKGLVVKRIIGILAAVLVALGLSTAPAGAADRGPTVDQLAANGWTCFLVPDLGMHCMPPGGGAVNGKGKAQNVLYFHPVTGAFAGTELLRFTDRDLSGHPCRGHDDGVWHHIGFAWACHHPAWGR